MLDAKVKSPKKDEQLISPRTNAALKQVLTPRGRAPAGFQLPKIKEKHRKRYIPERLQQDSPLESQQELVGALSKQMDHVEKPIPRTEADQKGGVPADIIGQAEEIRSQTTQSALRSEGHAGPHLNVVLQENVHEFGPKFIPHQTVV